MPRDAHHLQLTAAGPDAVAAYDHVIRGYLGYRTDIPARMAALMAADPHCAMAHCLAGYFALLGQNAASLPAARASAAQARAQASHLTQRELWHVEALEHWAAGDQTAAIARWEAILAAHPTDILSLRLAHFTHFWSGRPQDMLASVDRVLPRFGSDLPGYATVLACRCFANEECGNYLAAEPDGRRAIALDPGHLWAAHAVAHVMEMQGRRLEGIAWLTGLAPNWAGTNNLQHHLWWHCALFHLEQGDFATVLDLYDQQFRNLSAPLTVATPDAYIDVQNAASMLFRLQRLGVEVGARWQELADKAAAKIGDCQSPFTLPHWMMALSATGRTETAAAMLSGIRRFAEGGGTHALLMRDVALPVAEAVHAHGQGAHADAVALLRPALGEMHRLGGSHAQQDVLEQLFLDSALRAGLRDDVEMVLQRIEGRRPLPARRLVGWRMALAA